MVFEYKSSDAGNLRMPKRSHKMFILREKRKLSNLIKGKKSPHG
jgi:hypothetical protein